MNSSLNQGNFLRTRMNSIGNQSKFLELLIKSGILRTRTKTIQKLLKNEMR